MNITAVHHYLLTALTGAMLTGTAIAGDIGSEIRGTDSRIDGERGGFFELGIGAEIQQRVKVRLDPAEDDYYELGIGLSISAGYRYKRVFVEAVESSFDGLNLGVKLLENERWSVDLLLANVAGNITYESDGPVTPTTENERNSAILDRDSLFVAAGPRVTGYFGDTIIQFRLVSDWHDDNGIQASARVGRQWQVGNWNLQGIMGGQYYSKEFNDYLFGVDALEASNRFPVYQASDAFIPEVEVGASVPLNKDWVFTSRVRARHYPDSVTDSPLVARDTSMSIITGVRYVF